MGAIATVQIVADKVDDGLATFDAIFGCGGPD